MVLLPAPLRPSSPKQVERRHVEAHPVDGLHVAVGFVDIVEDDDGVCHGRLELAQPPPLPVTPPLLIAPPPPVMPPLPIAPPPPVIPPSLPWPLAPPLPLLPPLPVEPALPSTPFALPSVPGDESPLLETLLQAERSKPAQTIMHEPAKPTGVFMGNLLIARPSWAFTQRYSMPHFPSPRRHAQVATASPKCRWRGLGSRPGRARGCRCGFRQHHHRSRGLSRTPTVRCSSWVNCQGRLDEGSVRHCCLPACR
jgi:hypothetical protein